MSRVLAVCLGALVMTAVPVAAHNVLVVNRPEDLRFVSMREPFGHVHTGLAQRNEISVQHLRANFRERRASEHRFADDHLPKNHAERPHVRSCIDVARRAHLLGRHVAGRTEDVARGGDRA